MTLSEAREAIEKHLTEFLDEPEVSVDVFAYNSKFYYVVTEGAGRGSDPAGTDHRQRDGAGRHHPDRRPGAFPARPSGSPGRPRPMAAAAAQVLPVNWRAIIDAADTSTNWQVMPGRSRLRGRGQADRPG